MLRWLSRALLRLLYPEFCVSCNAFWTLLCPNCFEQLDFYSRPLRLPAAPSLTSINCAVHYGSVAHNLVHAAKFQSVRSAAKLLGKIVYWYCRPPPVDFVIPVPLGKRRLGERGFNQAAEFAREYAELCQAPFLDCLIRSKETKAQAQQTTKEERLHNMAGVFAIHPGLPTGYLSDKTILLVDDVISSGATLESCAQVLLAAGAKTIHAQTFAHGQITSSRGIMERLHGDVLH